MTFKCCVLVTLCGRASYRQVSWTEAIYERGDASILDGTEILKTAHLFTVHGTFQKFTFPVKREFKVYRDSDQKVIWNRDVNRLAAAPPVNFRLLAAVA